jgi:hypothetical protein
MESLVGKLEKYKWEKKRFGGKGTDIKEQKIIHISMQKKMLIAT